jgi:hypothetical protein
MGNQQSTENHQLTPEQYQQYQYFLQQQQQPNQRPQQSISNAPVVNRPLNMPNVQQYNQQNVQRQLLRPTQSNPTNNAFHNQQQQRTQIRPTNQNVSHQMIPNLQQKSQMPSIENNYQNAYQQRLNENIKFNKATNPKINYQQQEPDYMYNNEQYIEPSNISKNIVANTLRQSEYLEQEKIREQLFLKQQQQQQKEAYMKFKREQEQRKSQFVNEIDEISTLKYNPDQILGLTPGVVHTEKEIKTAYRNLAIKYHPDKGGSEEVFKILTKAYMYLLKQSEGQNYVEKNFMDLKKDYSTPQSQEYSATSQNSDDFNVKQFNKLFDENKLEDEDWEGGYGDWQTQNTDVEPKKIFNQKFNLDVFNQVFSELNNENKVVSDIQMYKEPEPLSLSNKIGYTSVDYKKTDDYSREYDIQDGTSKQGIYYTDYKKAYSNTTLINPSSVQHRPEYKTIEDLELYREKQEFTITNEDKIQIEEKKKKEEHEEYLRIQRLRQRDDQLTSHSAKVNRLLLAPNAVASRQIEYRK